MLQNRIDDQPTISRQMVREAQDILHRHLKEVGLKQTAQRTPSCARFLRLATTSLPMSFTVLYKKKDARIGYTTVYRTLKLLGNAALACEVAFHDGVAHSEHQYNRRSHITAWSAPAASSSVEFFSQEVSDLEQEIGHRCNYLTTRHTFLRSMESARIAARRSVDGFRTICLKTAASLPVPAG